MKKNMITICLVVVFLVVAGGARAGIWTTLDYPGAYSTSITGIDGSNLVGAYVDSSGSHGFLYDGTNWTTLEYPGAYSTSIKDIDGSNIVGSYSDTPNHNVHGFIYNGTNWTTLDAPGANYTKINGIDGSNLVGLCNYPTGGGLIWHGVIYDGISWTTLDVPGANNTQIIGIDGSNLVGWCRYGFSDGHGFLYDGMNWTILDAPGSTYTYTGGISGSNIVGGYFDSSNKRHAFLYDGTNWTTLDAPGAYSIFIYGIDGSNLVGSYSDASGNNHGFLYTIPASSATIDILADTITPKTKWIKCQIWPPDGYSYADIDIESILLEWQIPVSRYSFNERKQRLVVMFPASGLNLEPSPDPLELTVSGELTDGTAFEGSDFVTVVRKGGKKK